MAFEVVKEITSIEMQGEKLISDAKASNKEEEKVARDEANKIIERAENDAEKYYNSRIAFYEKQADKLIEPIMKECKENIQRLSDLPKDTVNKAVNMVIERIVVSRGNS